MPILLGQGRSGPALLLRPPDRGSAELGACGNGTEVVCGTYLNSETSPWRGKGTAQIFAGQLFPSLPLWRGPSRSVPMQGARSLVE